MVSHVNFKENEKNSKTEKRWKKAKKECCWPAESGSGGGMFQF